MAPKLESDLLPMLDQAEVKPVQKHLDEGTITQEIKLEPTEDQEDLKEPPLESDSN